MARTYHALAALLSYPTPELQAATGEIGAVLAEEDLVPAPQRTALASLLAELGSGDIYGLQERYVALFDRGRALSMHLFEHVHGESRDRGQAMADLLSLYHARGLEPDGGELPDFLPLFLEFLSLLPEPEAAELLSEPASILRVLGQRLAERGTAYATVFDALVAMTHAAPQADSAAASGVAIEHDDPDDLAALDVAWEEAAVHFGPGERVDACGPDRLRTRLRAAARDAAAA